MIGYIIIGDKGNVAKYTEPVVQSSKLKLLSLT